jgi:hypothetical protein
MSTPAKEPVDVFVTKRTVEANPWPVVVKLAGNVVPPDVHVPLNVKALLLGMALAPGATVSVTATAVTANAMNDLFFMRHLPLACGSNCGGTDRAQTRTVLVEAGLAAPRGERSRDHSRETL